MKYYLEKFNNSDFEYLFRIYSADSFNLTLNQNLIINSDFEFGNWFKNELRFSYLDFKIVKNENGVPNGLIYTYNYDSFNQRIWLFFYFNKNLPENNKLKLIRKSLEEVSEKIPVNQILVQIPEDFSDVGILKELNFNLEVNLKNYYFKDGFYQNSLIYSKRL